MIGPSQILDIGRRSLFAHQYALSVTSHNIANVNTSGYSRQRVIFETAFPLRIPQGFLGTGVDIGRIERIREHLIDLQVRDQISQAEEWEKGDNILKQIESLINEPSDFGLSHAIADFFNAWHDVANDPEESGPRSALVQKANMLSNTFHRQKTHLQNLVEELNTEVDGITAQINSCSTQIAKLNGRIVALESAGHPANDLRDERDSLVNLIAEFADVQTSENTDGSLTVYLNYKVIVDRITTIELTTKYDARHGMKFKDIFYQNELLTPESGQIKGIFTIRDSEIPDYLHDLDSLAANIIKEINSLHRSGYSLDGSSYRDFFKGNSAGNISVRDEIANNVSLIAASSSGSPGDGALALQIAELADKLTMTTGSHNFTFSDFYGSLVSNIGSTSLFSNEMMESEKLLLTQLENYQQSISGVSLDEEMVNMMNYQHAFEAAARVIQTADELFGTIINMV